ncbi:hypothetical protein BaRGS_00001925 [Batillaria attramentaria]|uniref:Uncharacterized protein n=1 Tax=Batillaria attramentaria TaxID=370345 RepID=A0ABD0M5Q2_9CAEN
MSLPEEPLPLISKELHPLQVTQQEENPPVVPETSPALQRQRREGKATPDSPFKKKSLLSKARSCFQKPPSSRGDKAGKLRR